MAGKAPSPGSKRPFSSPGGPSPNRPLNPELYSRVVNLTIMTRTADHHCSVDIDYIKDLPKEEQQKNCNKAAVSSTLWQLSKNKAAVSFFGKQDGDLGMYYPGFGNHGRDFTLNPSGQPTVWVTRMYDTIMLKHKEQIGEWTFKLIPDDSDGFAETQVTHSKDEYLGWLHALPAIGVPASSNSDDPVHVPTETEWQQLLSRVTALEINAVIAPQKEQEPIALE